MGLPNAEGYGYSDSTMLEYIRKLEKRIEELERKERKSHVRHDNLFDEGLKLLDRIAALEEKNKNRIDLPPWFTKEQLRNGETIGQYKERYKKDIERSRGANYPIGLCVPPTITPQEANMYFKKSGLTFEEAMKEMREGKKIKRPQYQGDYIQMTGNCIVNSRKIVLLIGIPQQDILATDWEVV